MGISDERWYKSGHYKFSRDKVLHAKRCVDLDNKVIKRFKISKVYSGVILLNGTYYNVIYGKATSQIGEARPGSLVWTIYNHSLPQLLLIKSKRFLFITNERYKSIENQFLSSWKHQNKLIPQIFKIFKIKNGNLEDRYNIKRTLVERNRNLANKPFNGRRMTAGNEQKRFHGTSVVCKIGETGKLCSSNKCAVCCIIKNGYKIFETNKNFQRFGKGLYFSSTSSKSDDYIKNNSGSSYKVMLLNKVIVGNAYKLATNCTGLLHPPQGYDSVIGIPGGNLNYDEVVLYHEDSCLPRYLIVYR
ncbi:4887_t:CDS:2 [Cetraspora pellucida]|uniref:4887_t:CDS:1 n=1 Tax=Cetraspora pellucida TaxID=1433469 RepID=A0A9N9J677_9GLOM|nr:4887_t:CDS:2 [Cetraspora pellucida]